MLSSSTDSIEVITDIEVLRKLLTEREAEIESLKEAVFLLRRSLFGKKSEKLPEGVERGLFDEAEATAAASTAEAQHEEFASGLESEEEQQETITYTRPKARGKRKPLPEHLPREDVVIELPPEERICPEDGSLMTKVSEKVSEKLDVIPQQMKVIRTVRHVYSCKCCEEQMKTAPNPPQAIPKSIASEGLLAAIATGKFVDHLPLYRMETIFERAGVELSRGTMARWMVQVGELLQPLMNLLEEELLSSSYIQMDETRVQVLKEPGKTAESQSFLWARGRPGRDPIVLFEYDPTREGAVATRLLETYQGALQVDGYDGYNAVVAAENSNIVRFGCMAHARRKFFEASKASKKAGVANKALAYIQKLYRIEKECEAMLPDERKKIRQEKSQPLLDEIRSWLTEQIKGVPPQSSLGRALGYMDREWIYLSRYAQDGRVEIDNNFIENSIRPFAVGRKNWLFSDSVFGVKASASIYSLVVTAKLQGLDVYRYLKHVLAGLPKAQTLQDIEALLPRNCKDLRAPV